MLGSPAVGDLVTELVIRRETAADAVGVWRVHEQAFGRPDEARLVRSLRSAGAVTLALVGIVEGEVVAHIVFSPVTIDTRWGRYPALGLGPLAVVPSWQHHRLGSALVQAGISRVRDEGHRAIVVMGHADYYPRVGFEPASRHGIRWEAPCPDDSFMVLPLAPGALRERSGVVRYRPEFASV